MAKDPFFQKTEVKIPLICEYMADRIAKDAGLSKTDAYVRSLSFAMLVFSAKLPLNVAYDWTVDPASIDMTMLDENKKTDQRKNNKGGKAAKQTA